MTGEPDIQKSTRAGSPIGVVRRAGVFIPLVGYPIRSGPT